MTTNITTQDRPTTSTGTSWVADGKKSASRLRGPRRRRSIPHLLFGALMVLACAAAFLLLSLNAGDRVSVLALARPVAIGQVLTVQDLKQVAVAADPGVSVVDASQAASVVGRTMSMSLPAGALLPQGAAGGQSVPAAGQAIAALSLKPGQSPAEVAPGSHVSVVFVPGPSAAAPTSPAPPDAATTWPAVVISVASPPNQQGTVVSVQVSRVAAHQIAAVPAGQLSVVMLPGGGQ